MSPTEYGPSCFSQLIWLASLYINNSTKCCGQKTLHGEWAIEPEVKNKNHQ